MQLTNNCLRPFFLFVFFSSSFSLETSLFPEYFCSVIIAVFSFYREYVVCFPPLPGGVFLPCDHGLDYFGISLYLSIQSSTFISYLHESIDAHGYLVLSYDEVYSSF